MLHNVLSIVVDAVRVCTLVLFIVQLLYMYKNCTLFIVAIIIAVVLLHVLYNRFVYAFESRTVQTEWWVWLCT